jgi:hypothetical protein
MFLHPMGSAVHEVHSGASGARNAKAQFFMLRWDWCCFHKKRTGTSYVEFVFLHPVGYAGHVVQYGAFEVQHVDAVFCMLMWDRYGFHKKRTGTHYAELVFCIR